VFVFVLKEMGVYLSFFYFFLLGGGGGGEDGA